MEGQLKKSLIEKIGKIFNSPKPVISIIVVSYNMKRELPRTLYSLSRQYQLNIEELDYEVIVVDNGSKEDCSVDVKHYGDNFSYYQVKQATSSPVKALNYGASLAKGDVLCFMIDGARILSPGVLHSAWCVFSSSFYKKPTVSVVGFHLGKELQNHSILNGYNQEVENEMLEKIEWKKNGYRLFGISVFAGSCQEGWFGPLAESNAIFLHKDEFKRIGKFDENFDSPGGGFANLDFYYRAVMREGSELVVLLGEGSFHQVHGGIATNSLKDVQVKRVLEWRKQYELIRGMDFKKPEKRPVYYGKVDKEMMVLLKASILSVV